MIHSSILLSFPLSQTILFSQVCATDHNHDHFNIIDTSAYQIGLKHLRQQEADFTWQHLFEHLSSDFTSKFKVEIIQFVS